MITFHQLELPVADSMIRASNVFERHPHDRHVAFVRYMYLWIAFNNIYTTIAFDQGLHAKPRIRSAGAVFEQNGSVEIPRVDTVSERVQLAAAIAELDDDVRHRLVVHPNTQFFAYRRPRWHGTPFSWDAKGQRINGVINVNCTTDHRSLVWSPIDVPSYEKYISDPQDAESRRLLTRQIIELLYIVRCNLMHGGKRADDAVDLEVVEQAIPLLQLVVEAFLPEAKRHNLV